MAEAGDRPALPPATSTIGPAPGPGAVPAPQERRDAVGRAPAESAGERLRPDSQALLDDISEEGLITLADSFAVPHPPDRVWDVLSDLQTVAGCLPGARLTAQDGDRIAGEMRLKLGPMSPRFAGEGRIRRDDGTRRARIVGQARNGASASRARARIDYALVDSGDGGTRVEVEIGYALTGTLAQFSRGAIAIDLVRRLTATFATNLEAAIAGDADLRREEQEPQPLDAAGLLGAVVRARIEAWLRTLFGRGG
ncbi:MAG: SRPBCC family protein [Rhodospirillales bacterium]|nr:SRPBCC family protein [Rhodospirillales bacterium]